MSIENEIEELLDLANHENHGARQYELTKKALHLAEKSKNEKLIFEVKMAHIESTTFYGKDDEALLNFVWCRNIFLEKLDEYAAYSFSLLWDYKWIIINLPDNPQVTLEKINEIIEDFKSFADKLNYSKRAFTYLKFITLKATNNDQEATKYLGWQKMKQDELCDCEACEKDSIIDYYRDRKEIKVAKQKFEALIKSKKSCSAVPIASYASFLKNLVEEKDFATAKIYFDKCNKEISKSPNFINSQSEILLYLVLINDLNTGLKYFEKQFMMTIICSSIKDKLKFYISAELLFKKIKKDSGKKTLVLKLKKNDVLYNKENIWDIDYLIDFFESKNKKSILSFDARNQNKSESEIYKHNKKLAGV